MHIKNTYILTFLNLFKRKFWETVLLADMETINISHITKHVIYNASEKLAV